MLATLDTIGIKWAVATSHGHTLLGGRAMRNSPLPLLAAAFLLLPYPGGVAAQNRLWVHSHGQPTWRTHPKIAAPVFSGQRLHGLLSGTVPRMDLPPTESVIAPAARLAWHHSPPANPSLLMGDLPGLRGARIGTNPSGSTWRGGVQWHHEGAAWRRAPISAEAGAFDPFFFRRQLRRSHPIGFWPWILNDGYWAHSYTQDPDLGDPIGSYCQTQVGVCDLDGSLPVGAECSCPTEGGSSENGLVVP
jgi:hypothetical protein